MAKRNGNREVRKPKQDKQAKVQAATSISQLGSGTGLGGGVADPNPRGGIAQSVPPWARVAGDLADLLTSDFAGTSPLSSVRSR